MGQTESTASTPTKRFINDPHEVVEDTLEGFLWTTPGVVRLREGLRVLVRADWDREDQGQRQVAVVTGGGAGHEPADIGMIGQGMLTAVACGEIFAAPSVDSVVAMLEHVTGSAGCIVLVKNYLGDRLNFEMAIKKVASGPKRWKVRTVYVKDDVAAALLAQQSPEMKIPEEAMDQARTIAGTQLILKITGAAADEGLSLDEVHKEAQAAASVVRSLGVCFNTCTLPGHSTDILHQGDDQLHIGLGIHGEPAPMHSSSTATASTIISNIVAKLEKAIPPEGPLCAMLNNLGSVPQNEMFILAKQIMHTSLAARIQLFVGPARMVTALDMNGISLSVLPLNSRRKELLLAQTPCRHWVCPVTPCTPGASQESKKVISDLSVHSKQEEDTLDLPSAHPQVEMMLRRACDAICSAEAELDSVDNCVANGDCGRNLTHMAKVVKSSLPVLPLADPARFLWKFSDICRNNGGGLCSLLSIYFANASTILTDCNVSHWSTQSVTAAFVQSLKLLKDVSGADEGSGSFLDSLIPALTAAEQGKDIEQVARAARHGALATASMERFAGRAAYSAPHQLRGICDPGATAVALVCTAMEASMKGLLGCLTEVNDKKFRQKFCDLDEIIGEGSFGKVYAAVSHDSDDTSLGPLAIKVSKMDEETCTHQFRNLDALSRLVLTNWVFTEKEHVVKVHEVAVSPSSIYVVMERLSGPGLHEWLQATERIPERQLANVAKQILIAAKTFHPYGMVHRDIKPANFMFSNGSCTHLKLLDVAGTMGFTRLQANIREERVGTPAFMAPEELWLEHFSTATDMWSIGVTVFFMLSGVLPYDIQAGSTFPEDLIRLQRVPLLYEGDPWRNVSKEAKSFLGSLLVLEPKQRANVVDALRHTWICHDVQGLDAVQPAVSRMITPGATRSDIVAPLESMKTSRPVRKTVFLIRHGEAYHNIEEKRAKKQAALDAKAAGLTEDSDAFQLMVEEARQSVLDDERFRDAELSEAGRAMTAHARSKIRHLIQQGLPKPTCLLVSPLRRTLETASLIFPGHDNAHVREILQERRTGFPCDARSTAESVLTSEQFAFMSFNKLKQIDKYRSQFVTVNSAEAKKDVRSRSKLLTELLRPIEDESVALVTHKGFLRELERGPLNQVDAKEFDNCEVRVYQVSIAPSGDMTMKAVRVD